MTSNYCPIFEGGTKITVHLDIVEWDHVTDDQCPEYPIVLYVL
jgi:hypothetical protein